VSSKRRLRLVEAQLPVEPQVVVAQFVRDVITPPAPPWRQRQVAELEARLGAPIASGGLTYRIARLESWKLGRQGRFKVVYTRAGPSSGASGLQASASATASIGAAAFEDERTRLLIAIGVALVSLTLFGIAISSALGRRTDVAASLFSLDGALGRAEHRAAELAELDRRAVALDRVGGTDRSVERLLGDLDWLAGHRRPDVAIMSVHWLRGISAIETASSASPFLDPDRQIQRASHPIRPGVWLWGVVDARDDGK
jgi:hypothetical protein